MGGWSKKLVGVLIGGRWEVGSEKWWEIGPANRWEMGG